MHVCSCNFLTLYLIFLVCVGFVVLVFLQNSLVSVARGRRRDVFSISRVVIALPLADSNTSHLCQSNDLGEPAAAAPLRLQESPVGWGARSGG